MTELRWILLGLGALIVLGVYLWGRRTPAATESATVLERKAPDLGDLAADSAAAAETAAPAMPRFAAAETKATASPPPAAAPVMEPKADPEPAAAAAPPEPPVADKIVRLHIVGTEGETFNAAELVAALRAEGLRFGHFDLFHRFDGDGNPGPDSKPLFSASDMLKPGTFNLETLAETTLRGVSLFMLLPNPGDPVAVFADMLATGRRLAATTGGQLVDSKGCSISRQSASHMREDIINYHHGIQPVTSAEADRVT